MTYEVHIARQAERYVQRVPPRLQQRILIRLQQIGEDPYGPHTKPLVGLPGRRAARVGSLRIVFAVDDAARRVNVSDIGPRGQIYRSL